jgi:hypothetical protein
MDKKTAKIKKSIGPAAASRAAWLDVVDLAGGKRKKEKWPNCPSWNP